MGRTKKCAKRAAPASNSGRVTRQRTAAATTVVEENTAAAAAPALIDETASADKNVTVPPADVAKEMPPAVADADLVAKKTTDDALLAENQKLRGENDALKYALGLAFGSCAPTPSAMSDKHRIDIPNNEDDDKPLVARMNTTTTPKTAPAPTQSTASGTMMMKIGNEICRVEEKNKMIRDLGGDFAVSVFKYKRDGQMKVAIGKWTKAKAGHAYPLRKEGVFMNVNDFHEVVLNCKKQTFSRSNMTVKREDNGGLTIVSYGTTLTLSKDQFNKLNNVTADEIAAAIAKIEK